MKTWLGAGSAVQASRQSRDLAAGRIHFARGCEIPGFPGKGKAFFGASSPAVRTTGWRDWTMAPSSISTAGSWYRRPSPHRRPPFDGFPWGKLSSGARLMRGKAYLSPAFPLIRRLTPPPRVKEEVISSDCPPDSQTPRGRLWWITAPRRSNGNTSQRHHAPPPTHAGGEKSGDRTTACPCSAGVVHCGRGRTSTWA